MKLKILQSALLLSRLIGDGDVEISGIELDSRKVKPGDLFVCINGAKADGHKYAEQAIQHGAAALVTEKPMDCRVPMIVVKHSREALSRLASLFYGNPSREMNVIGITGTNGKTTSSYIIEKILNDCGKRAGVMGTIETRLGEISAPMERTTVESHELQKSLRWMRENSAEYCVMEVSSHALKFGRAKGTHFRTALFTNLTQDHLDYHHTMEEYRAAKGLLFSRLGNDFSADPECRQYAVLNMDDPASAVYAKLTAAEVVTYGLRDEADVRAEHIRVTAQGTYFEAVTFEGTVSIHLKLLGRFNVYNALGAIAVSLLEGVPLDSIKNSLEEMRPVQGRMEIVDEGQDFTVVVDYSHTPDGLDNALKTIREFTEGRVVCVFGCGGDRDRTKRPLMGEIAGRYSDYVFVTSDNPRSENAEAILQEIEPGVKKSGKSQEQYELLPDRRAAIQKAVGAAAAKDVILIAGKGHETYQILNDRTIHFDDREEARQALRNME